jgi:magnesium transporter
VADIEDQFHRVRGVADAQIRYLQGVTEFHQARTNTKWRSPPSGYPLIATITLPITALSSIHGLSIIVNDRTDFAHLAVVLAVRIVISVTLLRWAKRQGWW